MESKTNYTVVGLTTVVLMAGLLTASLWLSVGFDQKKYNTYIVYMCETVSGLNEDSQVKFNGVKVGAISGIEINKKDPQQVKLFLKIEAGTPITTSTQAALISQGITGTNYLGLTAKTPITTPLKAMPGEKYPVITYKPSFFNQLEKTVEEISVSMKGLINKKNTDNLSKAIENLTKITNTFAKNSQALDKTLKDMPKIMREVKDSVKKFSDMSEDVSDASDKLSTTMDAGRNVIDKISQQAIPPTVILLRRLDVIAANLEQVSIQLRDNPAVILRGSAPQKPGPGE
ncbi:MAG: MlaD family protein [Legionellaceae bacterium]|nr:MlaD family protein [Legionellaceae bacterium]